MSSIPPNMSSRPRPPSPLRRFPVGRGLLVLMVCGLAMAVALTLTRVAPPAHAATDASADDTTWGAGDVSWSVSGDTCTTTQTVGISAGKSQEWNDEMAILKGLGTYSGEDPSTHIQDVEGSVDLTNAQGFAMTLTAHLPAADCQSSPTTTDPNSPTTTTNNAFSGAAGTTGLGSPAVYTAGPVTSGHMAVPADYLPRTVPGSHIHLVAADAGYRGSMHAAIPFWLKGAIGALVGAAVYVGVSLAIAAGIEALGILAGASATTIAAVTALSGCIGGATSTAATLAIGGGNTSWQATLANAVTGCITGAAIGALSLAQRAKAVGQAIRGFFGGTAAETVGDVASSAASSAGTELGAMVGAETAAADDALALAG
jgi:hypothetical protein